MDCLAWMMGGLLLRMMGCAGYGGEVINSDFYGKRSKLCLDFYGKRSKIGLKIYGKRSKFERRNIKKHRAAGSVLFCGDGVLRRGDGPQGGCGVAAQRRGLAFQDFEGGAGGGSEHVDAGCQTFKRFCGLDSGAERDAVNREYIDYGLAVDGHNLQAALHVVD